MFVGYLVKSLGYFSYGLVIVNEEWFDKSYMIYRYAINII